MAKRSSWRQPSAKPEPVSSMATPSRPWAVRSMPARVSVHRRVAASSPKARLELAQPHSGNAAAVINPKENCRLCIKNLR